MEQNLEYILKPYDEIWAYTIGLDLVVTQLEILHIGINQSFSRIISANLKMNTPLYAFAHLFKSVVFLTSSLGFFLYIEAKYRDLNLKLLDFNTIFLLFHPNIQWYFY